MPFSVELWSVVAVVIGLVMAAQLVAAQADSRRIARGLAVGSLAVLLVALLTSVALEASGLMTLASLFLLALFAFLGLFMAEMLAAAVWGMLLYAAARGGRYAFLGASLASLVLALALGHVLTDQQGGLLAGPHGWVPTHEPWGEGVKVLLLYLAAPVAAIYAWLLPEVPSATHMPPRG